MSRKDLLASTSSETISEFLLTRPEQENKPALAEVFQAAEIDPEPPVKDFILSEEERPYETLILMGEVACNLIDATEECCSDLVDYEYDVDPETGHVDLLFGPAEGLDAEQTKISLKMIRNFLEKLEDFADEEHASVFPELGSMTGRTKMDLLDLLTEYNQKYEATMVNLMAPAFTVENLSKDFMAFFNDAASTARQAVESDVTHADNLLATSPLRPYLSLEDYQANAQIMYAATSVRQMSLSVFFTLIDEKIKLEDRDHPLMNKPSLRPSYILN